jgi:beta-galactosidase
MQNRFDPISKKCPHFLHGGDYNPEQWLRTPKILQEDLRLMKLAGCNEMTVGVFSWVSLEPEEGKFNFGWLDSIMDGLAKNGIYVVLATPSGARPAWMSHKYPEVLRVTPDRRRIFHGGRHNHCYTSPVYREKCRIINTRLAERYKDHPALLVWHISNEYSGDCHCELCQEAFREWLRNKYADSLDKLNHAWWTAFWSHTYTDWQQIEPPGPLGEGCINGLGLDWRRFATDQTIDFFKAEIAPLRKLTPDVPVTTNLMGINQCLNYWKFAKELDVVSNDSYPRWHGDQEDWKLALQVAFIHDLYRSMKDGRPFMLMESTPSMTNWMKVAKLKRPGMHLLSSLQAVAHGSDTVQYFQWRKSRGSAEKYHGAVVDHSGHEKTRVFSDVAEVGRALKKLDEVIGTTTKSQVAVIYDWENSWAIDGAQGLRWEKNYIPACMKHYQPFWSRSVPVDVIDMESDFSRYKVLIAPMLYMVRDGVGGRIEKFVADGGVFVATYWSGIVDENDLCFLGGFPGPLRKVMGIWAEEIDSLCDKDSNYIVPVKDGELGLSGKYQARELCELIHAETARVLATYAEDFYAGRPALTANDFGKGRAYYIASRNEERFLEDFYSNLVSALNLRQDIKTETPTGVMARSRTDGKQQFVFIMNFTASEQQVELSSVKYRDMLAGKEVTGRVTLPAYGIMVLQRQ